MHAHFVCVCVFTVFERSRFTTLQRNGGCSHELRARSQKNIFFHTPASLAPAGHEIGYWSPSDSQSIQKWSPNDFHPEASSSILKHPQASSGILKHPEASWSILKHTQAYPSILKHSQASSSILKYTTQASWSIVKHTQAFPSILKHPQVSSSILKHPEASWSILKHTQASSSIQKHSPASWSIPKHPQASWSIPKAVWGLALGSYYMMWYDIISYDMIWEDKITRFLTCSGHVPKKFGGSNMKFFQKVLGTFGLCFGIIAGV